MTRTLLCLAGVALAYAAPAVRADALDAKLNDEMPGVMKHLRKSGYRSVGVLPFQATRGKVSGFSVGPINYNMCERLENLLVIHGGPAEAEALTVLRDVGPTAARAGGGSWTAQAGRKALFGVSFPAAWGKKEAKADVFLTGSVRCVGDRARTAVTIQSFDRKDPAALTTVCRFTVETDRSLIRDLGSSFNLPPKALAAMRGQTRARVDVLMRRSVYKMEEGESAGAVTEEPSGTPDPLPDVPAAKGSSPANVGGVEVKLLVGDDRTEQPMRESSGTGRARWQVEAPPQGQPIVIRLRNQSRNTLGVVLKLNGSSTILEQREPSDQCRKYVMGAGKTFFIEGFLVMGKAGKIDRLKPFQLIEGEEAKKLSAEYGSAAGLIDVDVFEEGGATAPSDGLISVRKPVDARSRGSYVALRSALMKGRFTSAVNPRSGAEMIRPDTKTVDADQPDAVDFAANPTPVGSLKIKVAPRD